MLFAVLEKKRCFLLALEKRRSFLAVVGKEDNDFLMSWKRRLCFSFYWNHGWRKQWIIHQGWESAYAARSLSQYILAFATRVLPSTYVCVKGERAWARIFKLFHHDPRHQFHGISTLVSETLHPLATLALLHMIPWTFLHSLNVWKFGLWRTMSVCYVTLSQIPSGLNLCHIMKTVHKT